MPANEQDILSAIETLQQRQEPANMDAIAAELLTTRTDVAVVVKSCIRQGLIDAAKNADGVLHFALTVKGQERLDRTVG